MAAGAASDIKARALALGFEAAGVAAVGPLEAEERYEAWLAAGYHGGMTWLESARHRARRADPTKILPGLRSVVCVALCHDPTRDDVRDHRLGRIARYAAGGDYHDVMADLLGALAASVREILPGSRPLWYSDTGAILERGWAERAGLGWIGKHTGLLSQSLGSWFLLGELLLDRPLDTDAPSPHEHCGTCLRCIEACPTRAIVAPYRLDARLCISYLTIEHRGPIPSEVRPAIGDWVFGCDLCQEACPWNRFAPEAREARLHARALDGWTLEGFLDLDEAGFRALFAGSPILRASRGGFLRNVCVALGNRGAAAAAPRLVRVLAGDPEALVRGHAAWALGELGARAQAGPTGYAAITAALERAAGTDPAADVRGEAAQALERVRATLR